MEMYIVMTELFDFETRTWERWYYGTYDHDTANEVAYNLGNDRKSGVFHSVIPASEAVEWGVKNLPR